MNHSTINTHAMKKVIESHGGWLFVAAASIIVYANSLANGFALDDIFIIQLNSRVHDLGNQREIWLTPYWPLFGQEFGLYRPLAIFGYAVQWAISGGTPMLFHACNVLLHTTASVLVFFLLQRLLGVGPAIVGGLVFAVHPVHTEAVANVVGQAELIAGVTTLGAVLLHASRPDPQHVGWGRRIAILALFLIGVLAKESAIVLPGLLVALDVAQRRVLLARQSVVDYARAMAMPTFLLAAAAVLYLAVRVDVLGSIGGTHAAPAMPFLRTDDRILTAFRAWPEYVRLLFFPLDLSADYSPAVILPVERLAGLALLGLGLLAGTVLLACATPWFPLAGLAAAWFLISVLPTSNLLMPVGIVVAERTLYTPSVTAALIAGGLWAGIVPHFAIRQRQVQVAVVSLALILGGFAYRSVIRNPEWKSLGAVWNAMTRDHPESYRAQWILGSLSPTRDLRIQRMEFAIKLWPYDSELLSALAFDYMGTGRFEDAIPLLERARALSGFVPRTHVLLAYAYIATGRPDDALQSVLTAERTGAARIVTAPIFAEIYDQMGRNRDAVGAWRVAVGIAPSHTWQYRARLARAYARAGHSTAALATIDSAVGFLPDADSTGAATLDSLRTAVQVGCFDQDARGRVAGPCRDPLEKWVFLLQLPASENASSSQNATAPTVPPAADTRGVN